MTPTLLEMNDGLTTGSDVIPSFARHETFHPRYGWLKKGFDAASTDPGVFLRDDAVRRLGLGKNMVRALRYWCAAYKILEEAPSPENPRLKFSYPTRFGESLLGQEGWDPYLEDPASLWLLHWHLLKPPCLAAAWYVAFNHFRASDFADRDLVARLRQFCDDQVGWESVADGSLEKDAKCILRMYSGATTGRGLIEDTVDSPFSELELIQVLRGAGRHFGLNMGEKPSLSPAIVAYAAVDYIAATHGSRVPTLGRLATAPGSPGRVFVLSESLLGDLLEPLQSSDSGLRLTQAAGTRQLLVEPETAANPEILLERYYAARPVLSKRQMF